MTETTPIAARKDWIRTFFIFWIGQAVSLLGSNLVQFALIWWMTKTTGSAIVLTLATLFTFLPDVFLAPFIGALVDRWDRRKIMILADGGIALATLALAYLFYTGIHQIWHIYLLLFMRGVGANFHWASEQASISMMVPKAHLARVGGINQALRGGLNVVGPPLGALLLEITHMHIVLGIDVLTAFVAIVSLLFIRIPNPKMPEQPEPLSAEMLLGDVKAGFSYVSAWKGLFYLLIMAALVNFLLSPTFSLLPLLVTEHFHGVAWHLSALQAAMGVGVVAGGLVMGAWGGTRRKIYTVLFALLGMALAMILLGAAPATGILIGMGALFLSGFMNPIANSATFAIVQTKVSPEKQGRVFSLVSSISAAMVPAAMLIAGPVAESWGIRIWYWVAGIGCGIMALGALMVPAITSLEQQAEPELQSSSIVDQVQTAD